MGFPFNIAKSSAIDITAVAAPRIDYAEIIWHRPKDTHTAPTTSQLRALSSPVNHPIHIWITEVLRDGRRPHISNLENLIKHYQEYIQLNMEHIAAYIRPPWWKLTATTAISNSNKEEATKEHQQRLQQIPAQDLITYTDGSGHGGQIGAAIYSPTINVTKGKTEIVHIYQIWKT